MGGKVANSSSNKVIEYGLAEIVDDLRIKKSWGATRIREYLVEHELPQKGVIMSESSINRYLQMRGFIKSKDQDTTEAVNVYRSYTRSLETTEEVEEVLINRIHKWQDLIPGDPGYDDPRVLTGLVKEYTGLGKRKDNLVTSIAGMQKQVYSILSMSQLITKIFEMVHKADPTLALEITREIQRNPEMQETFRKIKGVNK